MTGKKNLIVCESGLLWKCRAILIGCEELFFNRKIYVGATINTANIARQYCTGVDHTPAFSTKIKGSIELYTSLPLFAYMAVYRGKFTVTFLLAFILVMLKFQVLVVAASELIGVMGRVVYFTIY